MLLRGQKCTEDVFSNNFARCFCIFFRYGICSVFLDLWERGRPSQQHIGGGPPRFLTVFQTFATFATRAYLRLSLKDYYIQHFVNFSILSLKAHAPHSCRHFSLTSIILFTSIHTRHIIFWLFSFKSTSYNSITRFFFSLSLSILFLTFLKFLSAHDNYFVLICFSV